MKEDTKGRPKKRKRHDKKAVPVLLCSSAGELLDPRQWLEDQFERIMRCYHEMKAKRDKEPG